MWTVYDAIWDLGRDYTKARIYELIGLLFSSSLQPYVAAYQMHSLTCNSFFPAFSFFFTFSVVKDYSFPATCLAL